MNARSTNGYSLWVILLTAALSTMLAGGLSSLYWSSTTISRNEVREELAKQQAEIDLIRSRQDDVRLNVAAILADLQILKAQHTQFQLESP